MNSILKNENIQTELFQSIIDKFRIGLYSFDSKGNFLFANHHFLKILGYSPEELHLKSMSELFYEEDLPLLKKSDNFKQQGQIICARKKDGGIIPLQVQCKKDFQDISFIAFKESVERNSLLSKTEDIINILDRSVAFFTADVNGNILHVNDGFCRLSGYKREKLTGKRQGFIQEDLFEKITANVRNNEIWKGEINYIGKSGAGWWGDTTITPFLTEEGYPKQFIAVCTDITNKKKSEEQLFEIEFFDFLTKLPNRRYFEQMLEKEISLSKDRFSSFSLILLDMHGVKFVNDSLGTKVGDELIKQTARRLGQFLGKRGTLFRIDGDEFAIIIPDVLEEHIKKMAEEILALFEEPFNLSEYELFHAINIGISRFPDHGNNVHMLTRNTYASLNQSKIKGKNSYSIFSTNMNMELKKRFQLSVDLPKAFKKDQFYIDFQPRVEAKTNEIIGAEALVRWKHPKWGIVSPMDFIPLAEENGLIGLIGKLVLLEACRQNKKWQDAGLPAITVSVNLSVIELLQLDIVQTVEQVLKTTGLSPQWLEIELTESALIKDESTVMLKLEKLREMGIKTAIDDFGTGYASLSYLKTFKANTLKIDRSFITGIPEESSSFEIVTAIIGLAKKLNIRTTAEGVETIEQLNHLQKINCDEIQGYLYSRPLAATDFEKLLRKKFCFPV